MSMHYGTMCGVAMVFSEKDMSEILQKYAELYPESDVAAAIQDDYFSFEADCECMLKTKNNTIIFTRIEKNFAMSAEFTPFKTKNKELNWNQGKNEVIEEYWWEDDEMYALFSNKDITGPNIFVETPYPTYEDLKNEYVEKFKELLPDDFNYESRIGYLSCATCF